MSFPRESAAVRFMLMMRSNGHTVKLVDERTVRITSSVDFAESERLARSAAAIMRRDLRTTTMADGTLQVTLL